MIQNVIRRELIKFKPHGCDKNRYIVVIFQ